MLSFGMAFPFSALPCAARCELVDHLPGEINQPGNMDCVVGLLCLFLHRCVNLPHGRFSEGVQVYKAFFTARKGLLNVIFPRLALHMVNFTLPDKLQPLRVDNFRCFYRRPFPRYALGCPVEL